MTQINTDYSREDTRSGRRPQPKKALRAIFRRPYWGAEASENHYSLPATGHRLLYLSVTVRVRPWQKHG